MADREGRGGGRRVPLRGGECRPWGKVPAAGRGLWRGGRDGEAGGDLPPPLLSLVRGAAVRTQLAREPATGAVAVRAPTPAAGKTVLFFSGRAYGGGGGLDDGASGLFPLTEHRSRKRSWKKRHTEIGRDRSNPPCAPASGFWGFHPLPTLPLATDVNSCHPLDKHERFVKHVSRKDPIGSAHVTNARSYI